jgi:hypothetical protein
MSLFDELSKPEYQSGTYVDRLATLHSKSDNVVGKIAYGNTLHLVSMLARGLRRRIESCQAEQLRDAWSEALNPAYLGSPAYSINVALPEIRAMLDAGVAAGVCLPDEHEFIIQLATHQRQLWPDVTLRDVVAHFEPDVVNVGDWSVVSQLSTNRLMLRTTNTLPESDQVRVEMRESHNGQDWSPWRRVIGFSGVQEPGVYYQDIAFNGRQREIRWRGERYRVIGTVEAI